ncbi:hypothetical protein DFH09DRAFT_1474604 [Mycena vulgaris]|nr:hypothetical protein DFH09DRAFT_1474604 [Mycena vulgaris]
MAWTNIFVDRCTSLCTQTRRSRPLYRTGLTGLAMQARRYTSYGVPTNKNKVSARTGDIEGAHALPDTALQHFRANHNTILATSRAQPAQHAQRTQPHYGARCKIGMDAATQPLHKPRIADTPIRTGRPTDAHTQPQYARKETQRWYPESRAWRARRTRGPQPGFAWNGSRLSGQPTERRHHGNDARVRGVWPRTPSHTALALPRCTTSPARRRKPPLRATSTRPQSSIPYAPTREFSSYTRSPALLTQTRCPDSRCYPGARRARRDTQPRKICVGRANSLRTDDGSRDTVNARECTPRCAADEDEGNWDKKSARAPRYDARMRCTPLRIMRAGVTDTRTFNLSWRTALLVTAGSSGSSEHPRRESLCARLCGWDSKAHDDAVVIKEGRTQIAIDGPKPVLNI